MHFRLAVDAVSSVAPEQFAALSEVLSPKLIEQYLHESGTVTLCKRSLPLELTSASVVPVDGSPGMSPAEATLCATG